jgi:CRISPR/Cas system endoribonuclease Cas6 (RAMP superfamily)
MLQCRFAKFFATKPALGPWRYQILFEFAVELVWRIRVTSQCIRSMHNVFKTNGDYYLLTLLMIQQ